MTQVKKELKFTSDKVEVQRVAARTLSLSHKAIYMKNAKRHNVKSLTT